MRFYRSLQFKEFCCVQSPVALWVAGEDYDLEVVRGFFQEVEEAGVAAGVGGV